MIRRDLRLTREVGLPPEKVYELLTRAEALRSWWLAEARTDPRNLGRFRLRWPAPLAAAGGARAASPSGWLKEGRGTFVDLEPGRKVAWVWDSKGLPRGLPALTSVFLEPTPGGTRVTVLHAGFPASAGRLMEACRGLWSGLLDRLAR